MARIATFRGWRVTFGECERVIVREFFTGCDIAHRLDPDATIVDHGVAVRITRMIDPARIVAVDCGIDDDAVVDCKQERVMSLTRYIGIPRLGLLW